MPEGRLRQGFTVAAERSLRTPFAVTVLQPSVSYNRLRTSEQATKEPKMNDEDLTHTAVEEGPYPPRRRRKRLPIALGSVAVAGVLAVGGIALAGGGGSDGPGVAHAGSTSNNRGSHSGSGSERDQLLAFAKCMREHGISDFPDPDRNGGIALQGTPGGDLDKDNPQFAAALTACKHLMPNGGEPQQSEQDRRKNLAYSKCMRAHGLKDFPDPDKNGGISVELTPGSDLAPDNPQFQAADKACKDLLPGGGKGRSTQGPSSSSGASRR
jgi:hypothetical protein